MGQDRHLELSRRLLSAFVALAAAGLAAAPARGDEVTYLPGAAETAGEAGARFSSTLFLFNPSTTAATVRFDLIPAPGNQAPPTATRTLAPGETLTIPSVLPALFGLDDGTGTIVAAAPSPLVASLSTQNVAGPGGAYGLTLLPVPEDSLLLAGESGHALWASQSADPAAGSRTNVAVTLVDPGSSVAVRVFDDAGQPAGSAVVSSGPPASWQGKIADLIGPDALPVGRVEFHVVSGRATGYVVVNDNVTSDAIASQAERCGTGPTDRLLNGVAKTWGMGGAFWSTDVRIFNPGDATVAVIVEAIGFSTSPTPIIEQVPPGGLVELENVLDLLGLPDGVAGALRFRAATPVVIGARTVNGDPTGRRPGTFSSQEFVQDLPGGLLGAGQRGFVVGVEQGSGIPGARTNLALLGGPVGGDGRLVLRDPSGSLQATAPFSVKAFSWEQMSLADWFPAASLSAGGWASAQSVPPGSRVDVEMTAGSADLYAARIDNGSGDPMSLPVALEPKACAVAPFQVERLAISPAPLVAGLPGALSWDYGRGGLPLAPASQELSLGGQPLAPLDPSVRALPLTFSNPGPHEVVLSAHDGCRATSRRLEIAVCQQTTLTPEALPAGEVGSAYQAAFGADGNGPYAWKSAGPLPDGLTLDGAGGLLSGTPTKQGSFPFTMSAVDANGCGASRDYTLAIACGAGSIEPSAVEGGTVGTAYAPVTFSQVGASGAASWTVSSGALPPGFSLSAAGVLSGTPSASGTFAFTIQAADAAGCRASASLILAVCAQISVLPPTVRNLPVGVAIEESFASSGGSGDSSFALTAGALPPGLALTSAGSLSGTPSTSGSYAFTITATDSAGCSGSRAYVVDVGCPVITISPSALPDAVVGKAYLLTLTASGGNGTTRLSLAGGTLPTGITLSSDGVLSGTPTSTGKFYLAFTATDSFGCKRTQAMTLTVSP